MDVLITGTTVGGIGFETAKQLLKDGHRVFIVCRNKQKTEETIKALSTYGKVEKAADSMDLEDLNSIRAFAKEFKQDRLNCLINNAGVMAIPELRRTKQGVEMHVGVNFLSHYLLSRLLIDRLVRGAQISKYPSRIVNVSSDAHLAAKEVEIRSAFEGGEAYNAQLQYAYSKLFQLWDTADINRRYASSSAYPSVLSFSVHPGVVETNLARELPKQAVESLKKRSQNDPVWRFRTPAEGALTTLFCATAPLAELKCFPPLQDHESHVQYYRDVARAERLTKLARNTSMVDELVKVADQYCVQSKL